MTTRCLACGRRIPVGARKGRCATCLSGLDAARNAITPSVRRIVLERDGYLCQIRRPGCTVDATTVDHILPLSKGGANALSNYRAACKPCNSGRRDRE